MVDFHFALFLLHSPLLKESFLLSFPLLKLVSSSRRKQRKAHFAAGSNERRVRMSSPLSAELRSKHNVRSLPIHKDDEVMVTRGEYKGRQGKVLTVYRKKWCIHIEKLTREKQNGATVQLPVHPSKVVIQKLKLTGSRQALIDRKSSGKVANQKNKSEKFSEAQVSAMSTVD